MHVEPNLWNALAGPAAVARVPTQGSNVFFFPNGYAEQSSAQAPHHSATFLCRVFSLSLLVDPETDEVFAKIGLDPYPITHHFLHQYSWTPIAYSTTSSTSASADAVRVGEFTTYTKIITKTDLTYGHGLRVKKSGIIGVFPPILLDVNREKLAKDVFALDVHERIWIFVLIHENNPPRHVLKKWTKFATENKLVEGDTVVFVRHPAGDIFIGISRTGTSPEATRRASKQVASMAKATQLAREGLPFEVSYYPRVGSPEHVVKAIPVPLKDFSGGRAAESSPSSDKSNSSKGKSVQGVSEVQSLDNVKRSRGNVGEEDESNKEGGSRQSPGASSIRSIKLFGRQIQ